MTYTNNQKACLLLRLFIGVMFLFAAFGKIKMGIAASAVNIADSFKDTMLPHGLVLAYACALPAVELLLGITLLLGIFTDVMLMLSGMVMISLYFGMMITGHGDIAAYNALYFLIIVCAIRWFEHVAPSVDVMTRKKKPVAPSS